MTTAEVDLRATLWEAIPQHLAAAAADAGLSLALGDLAALCGARTPTARAALAAAVAVADKARRYEGHSEIDVLDQAARPLIEPTAHRLKPDRWNGLAVYCPKDPTHRIGAIAIRFGAAGQLLLRNAAGSVPEMDSPNIADVTRSKQYATRQRARTRALRSSAQLQRLLDSLSDSVSGDGAADEIATGIACMRGSIDDALERMQRGAPGALEYGDYAIDDDPYWSGYNIVNPAILLFCRLEDAVRVVTRAVPSWWSSVIGETLEFRCPDCTYRGTHRVANLLTLYAQTAARGESVMRLAT